MANNHSHTEKPENRTNQTKQGDQPLAIVRAIHFLLAETQYSRGFFGFSGFLSFSCFWFS
jgi:hypothetical protein